MDSRNILVSCIIPTRNRPQMVVSAIHSVLSQTHKKMEIIIIDDSTNEETRKILSRSDFPIKYIKNDVPKGAPYSRNVGLSEAKGDVISFLDDDDIWMPHKIEVQLSHLDKCPMIGCSYSRVIKGRNHYIKLPPHVSSEEMFYFNYLGSCSFVMVAREVVSNCFFDEDLASGQDWDMWINIMKKNSMKRILISQKYLVSYNVGEYTRISDPQEAMKRNVIIFNKYANYHDDHTAKMFFLYNMLPADNSFSVAIARDFLKTKLKKKPPLFSVLLFINKLFLRRTIVF